MGYLRPTAIIVSGSYGKGDVVEGQHWTEVAHDEATRIFRHYDLALTISPITLGVVNNVRSFLIAWDGSKEGWKESDAGDAARTEFVEWLRQQAYDDGSSPLDWIEVQYGGDDRKAMALAHSGETPVSAE